ncbi:MAG: HAD family hydrolase [Dehalococcoidia bacterium]
MTHPRIEAVLFDFDGTLGTYRSHLGEYIAAAAEYGVTVTAEALAATLEDAWREWQTPEGVDHAASSASEARYNAEVRSRLHVARLAAAGATGDLEAIAARICELECAPAAFEVYADTPPALARLKAAGLRTVIVSNHVWRLPEVVEALGLGPLVDVVVTSARAGYRKPHPAIYRIALEATGCASGAALFVGDSPSHDIEGPRAAGMQAVLIDRKGRYPHLDGIDTLADLEVPGLLLPTSHDT